MLTLLVVLVKNPSDFVGAHLGQSEQQTKGILAAAVGKVLVIDEAYGLFPGGSGSGDPYKTAVIDTIVAEVQSVPGDDRAVILCGYRSQMENMFQNVNPGLSRRFPLASAFVFEDFTDNELQQILCLKLKQQGFEASGQSKAVVKDMLNRARNRPNFGNAGEIDVLLDAAKARHQTRLSKGETKCQKSLEPLDFDENFDRADRAETNIRKLFEGTVGAEDVIAKLEGYQDNAKTMKLLGMDPKETVPFSFLFRGPPGTGKTTTAKKIGKVFYDMGFLATPKVIECSASEIIGQYVGQTAPKVRQMFDKALGRVLFIDEAYRLCDGAFGKEAIDEMVDAMTKDTYHKRLIIILAGYENQINSLMSVNPGLPSRFPGLIDFRAFSPTEGFDLLCKLLEKQRDILATKGHQLDLSRLIAPTDAFKVEVLQWFTRLVGQDQWASARDVQTVARGVFNATIQGAQKGITLAVEERVVVSELKSLFDERASQSSSAGSWTVAHDTPGSLAPRDTLSQLPSQVSTSTTSATKINTQTRPDDAQKAPPPPSKEPPVTRKHKTQACSPPQRKARRDTGVSDEVWEQLQRDQEAEVAREEEYQALRRSLKDAAEAARELIIGGLLAEEEEERKRQEEERKRQEALREKITRQLLAAEQRREREAEARKELAARGLCPAGFAWIAQSGGWRCKGGSHFVPDGQLQGMYRE
jgi:SpoVK/Ycf46/Vps4 family AAA+-type ATPase